MLDWLIMLKNIKNMSANQPSFVSQKIFRKNLVDIMKLNQS